LTLSSLTHVNYVYVYPLKLTLPYLAPLADGTLPAFDRLAVVLGLYSSLLLDDLSSPASSPSLSASVTQDLDGSGAIATRRAGAGFAADVKAARGEGGDALEELWRDVLAMGGPEALTGRGNAAGAGDGDNFSDKTNGDGNADGIAYEESEGYGVDGGVPM